MIGRFASISVCPVPELLLLLLLLLLFCVVFVSEILMSGCFVLVVVKGCSPRHTSPHLIKAQVKNFGKVMQTVGFFCLFFTSFIGSWVY